MVLDLPTEQVPLRTDEHGAIRVTGSRVTLDTVVAAFEEGATPEEIVYRYPTLGLADVYAIIAYFLRHQSQVRDYLTWRGQEEERVRAEVERRFDKSGIRERLMARRRQMLADDAARR